MSYLALDLGAGSGRAIVGTIESQTIVLDEVYRFSNNPVKLADTLYWDFLCLFANIKQGIANAIKEGYTIDGLAVDTWGVDFGLLDIRGQLCYNPVCYRDLRTQGWLKKLEAQIPKSEFYQFTGMQLMEINTVYQLAALKEQDKEIFPSFKKLLFTPDLINYFLTGTALNEYTIASTSQLLNATSQQWEKQIFDTLELPLELMQEIIQPCSVVGLLKKEVAAELGFGDLSSKVFAVSSHDTACAIAAIPEQGEDWAFLSSGTWSLLGVLSKTPYLSEEAMQNDFTNEGGADGNILFMRNITGLWLLQRLIAGWEEKEGKKCIYEDLIEKCSQAEPFRSIVNSDASNFVFPQSMTQAIQDYCRATNQMIPTTKAQLVRCVLDSLALNYSFVMDRLKACTGRDIKRLFIVGGGSRNKLLNSLIADALNVEVVTGLPEATAIGNIVQQAIADKKIADFEQAHTIIKKSFTFEKLYPRDNKRWMLAKQNFKHLFTKSI